ncbi:MAG: RNHCP domain-containing protein [Chloroflexota bacterium]
MSKTYRNRAGHRWPRREEFRCRHCGMFVVPVLCGGHHRNHCPYCLYSRHVDARTPGDRASECGSAMAPVGYFLRPKGEYVVVHRCLNCGYERHNRVAADDDLDLLLRLPAVPRRGGRPAAPLAAMYIA